jgi:transposase
MSFIRKRKRNGKIYLEEVENIRVKGRIIQRFIRHVGRDADGTTILSCSVSEAKIDSVKISGNLMVLHALAVELNLPSLLGEYSNEILSMVYAHCLDYKSLNNMKHWFERTDLNYILKLETLTEKRLVNAMDSIENLDHFAVQRNLFKTARERLGLAPKGVVYDVTNTYFRGKNCSIAKLGHDKEKRKGYPLIQIGLAVTRERGIPIFHKTFPGNVHDSRTFSDVSTELNKFGITDGIAVMDRGVSSAENTDYLRENYWKIICGLKLSNSIEVAVRNNLVNIVQIPNRVRVNQSVFYCIEKKYCHGETNGRLIVCYNKKRAQLQEESRFDEIEAAQIRLEQGKTIKPELQEFFGKDGRLINKRLQEAAKFDGVSFIFTNTKLSLNEIVKGYFDKDVVEKSFQSLKGVVNLRPIRHWLYNRVEAHVFICYLACLLLSVLKDRVRKLEISAISALEELEGLYRIYLHDPKTGFKLGKLVALTKKQEKILGAVNKHLLNECSGEKSGQI